MARQDAEAKAASALKVNETAEKLIREAADKQTAEAVKARDEAQKMLDTARLAHEQAVAKAQAEMTARVNAEQKVIAEKRARAAAEDRAKQEAVSRVMQEHQAHERGEKEIKAKVEAELKAREQAELQADIKARTEAQKRADATAAQRSLEQQEPAAKGVTVARVRKPVKWARMAAIGSVVLIALGLGLLQLVPLSGYIGGVEKLLSERLQEPVNIASLRFSLLPSPQIKLERIIIGKTQDVSIESAIIPVSSLAILDERKDLDEVQLFTVTIDQDAIPRLAGWAQPQAGMQRLQINRVKLSAVTLALRGVELPAFDATVMLDKDGGLQKALLRDSRVSVELVPIKDQGLLQANFSAKSWRLPVGPGMEFSDLSGTAAISRQQVAVTNIDGRVYNGALKGAVTVNWPGALHAEGDFSLKGADVGQVLSAFTREFIASGVLDASAKFTTQGQAPADLFAAPRVTATFTLQKGVLNNVDLVRAIQSPSRTGLRGGKTQFNEITGEAQVAGNRIAYRNLRLASGPLNAAGAVDVSPAADLSGRISVQVGSQTVTVARGTLNLGGNLKGPLLSQ